MLITYRRTGGVFALLTLAAVALAATVLTIAVTATLLIVALAVTVAVAVAVPLVRMVLPGTWRRHKVPPQAPWPHDTIEGTVVKRTPSDERDVVRMDSDKG